MHASVENLFKRRALTLIAGPCVIESLELCCQVAEFLEQLSQRQAISCIFKASFDKANRTSLDAFRGPGLQRGAQILSEVRSRFDVIMAVLY